MPECHDLAPCADDEEEEDKNNTNNILKEDWIKVGQVGVTTIYINLDRYSTKKYWLFNFAGKFLN